MISKADIVDDYELDRSQKSCFTETFLMKALHWDFDEHKRSFLRLFGFEIAGIDYSRDVDPEKVIPGIINLKIIR